jgi:hypothetical protein
MRRTILGVFAVVCFAVSPALLRAQEKFVPNYDEAKVPAYTLPEVLVMQDGTKVTTSDVWEKSRRPELVALFAREMFGPVPANSGKLTWSILEEDEKALEGTAHRMQIEIKPEGDGTDRRFELLLYIPNQVKGPVPVFINFNFLGNHTVHPDPAIHLATWRSRDPKTGEAVVLTSEIARGDRIRRFPVEVILKRGYALATVHYQAVYPDDAKAVKIPEGAEAGAISHWAWGYSRVTDVLSQLPKIDREKIVFLGHSRLGKTSLWAGANDPRAAIVISNDSGCGGASLARRQYGETVGRINDAFPHWFCGNYKKYGNDVNQLPFDAHELLALAAPRPVYVASATEDQWADPKGEFLALWNANPVYQLYGLEGIRETEQPAPEMPISAHNGYHLRVGKHDLLEYDWVRYLDFADGYFKK